MRFEDLNSRDYMDLSIIVLVILFIGILSYGIYIYDRQAVECLNDPIDYYQALKNYSCSCSEYNQYKDLDLSNITINSPI